MSRETFFRFDCTYPNLAPCCVKHNFEGGDDEKAERSYLPFRH